MLPRKSISNKGNKRKRRSFGRSNKVDYRGNRPNETQTHSGQPADSHDPQVSFSEAFTDFYNLNSQSSPALFYSTGTHTRQRSRSSPPARKLNSDPGFSRMNGSFPGSSEDSPRSEGSYSNSPRSDSPRGGSPRIITFARKSPRSPTNSPRLLVMKRTNKGFSPRKSSSSPRHKTSSTLSGNSYTVKNLPINSDEVQKIVGPIRDMIAKASKNIKEKKGKKDKKKMTQKDISGFYGEYESEDGKIYDIFLTSTSGISFFLIDKSYLLGEGGSSKVYMAYNLELDEKVAAKFHDNKGRKESISRENDNLQKMGEYQGSCKLTDNQGDNAKFQEVTFMRYVEGRDLLEFLYTINPEIHSSESPDYYQTKSPITYFQCLHLTRLVLQAFLKIRANGLIYRDIKTENLRIHKPAPDTFEVSFVDFGAAITPKNERTKRLLFSSSFGYAPPEVCHVFGKEKNPYTYFSDLWSIGVTLAEILTGENFQKKIREILQDRKDRQLDDQQLTSEELCSLFPDIFNESNSQRMLTLINECEVDRYVFDEELNIGGEMIIPSKHLHDIIRNLTKVKPTDRLKGSMFQEDAAAVLLLLDRNIQKCRILEDEIRKLLNKTAEIEKERPEMEKRGLEADALKKAEEIIGLKKQRLQKAAELKSMEGDIAALRALKLEIEELYPKLEKEIIALYPALKQKSLKYTSLEREVAGLESLSKSVLELPLVAKKHFKALQKLEKGTKLKFDSFVDQNPLKFKALKDNINKLNAELDRKQKELIQLRPEFLSSKQKFADLDSQREAIPAFARLVLEVETLKKLEDAFKRRYSLFCNDLKRAAEDREVEKRYSEEGLSRRSTLFSPATPHALPEFDFPPKVSLMNRDR